MSAHNADRAATIAAFVEAFDFADLSAECWAALHQAGKSRVLQAAWDELDRIEEARFQRQEMEERAIVARMKAVQKMRGECEPRGDELAIVMSELTGRPAPWEVK